MAAPMPRWRPNSPATSRVFVSEYSGSPTTITSASIHSSGGTATSSASQASVLRGVAGMSQSQ